MAIPITSSFFGFIPENYDRYLGPFLFEPYALDLVQRIKKGAVHDVLEIAAGTGRVTHHLRMAIPANARLIATDLNMDMLSMAKSKYGDQEIKWQVADAQELPFDNESFDLVVCQFGYMFVPDKPKAFAEAYRVLRNGGSFLISTWDSIENIGPALIANRVITTYFEDDPPIFYSIPYSMCRPEELEALARNAGFTEITVDLVKKEGRSESADDVAKGFITGNPVALEIIKKDPALVDIIYNLVKNEYATEFGDKPMVAPLQAYVCQGKK